MFSEISKQEIIMVTEAFSRHSFSKINGQRHERRSQAEQLEEACWDGLLDDLLGDIIKKTHDGKRLSLNQVRTGNSILGIELCNYPQAPQHHLSIDPNLFMDAMEWN